MKITNIKGYYLSSKYGNGKVFGQPLGIKSVGIIEIHTDANITGIGETYAGIYVPELIEHAVNSLKDLLIGKDPLDIESLHQRMTIPFVTMNGFMKSITGAIEIALWDIKGKVEKKPIWQLLTGQHKQSIKTYASGGSIALNPTEIKDDVETVLDQGHTAYKMRIGYASWQNDLERIKAAKETLGSNDLMIDAIQGTLNNWDFDIALKNSCELDQFNPIWLEEPLHPSKLNLLRRLKNYIDIPFAMGEALSGRLDFDTYIYSGAIQYIQPDVTHCGGYLDAMHIIKTAKANGVKVAIHVWGSMISKLANLHLAIACDVDWLEIPTINLRFNDELHSDFNICNGIITDLPIGNGLGIDLDSTIKYKYKGIPNSGYRI